MWQYQVKLNQKAELYKFLAPKLAQGRVYIVEGSFGDVYIQFSVIREILEDLEEVESSILTLVCDEKYATLAQLCCDGFEKKASAVVCTSSGMAFLTYTLDSEGIRGNCPGLPIRLLPTTYPLIPDLISCGILSYINFFRVLAGSNRRGPVQLIESLFKKNHSLSGATPTRRPGVLISIDSYTFESPGLDLWISLYMRLENDGMSPYINATNENSALVKDFIRRLPKPRTVIIQPEECVSVVSSFQGGYIGSTSGLMAIQAYFNRWSRGIHIINKGLASNQSDVILDHSKNAYKVDSLSWVKNFPAEVVGNQVDLIYSSNINVDDFVSKVVEHLRMGD